MSPPWISGLYASLLGLLLLCLAVRVTFRRRVARVPIGDGDDKELRKRIRVHANAVENIPIIILLLFFFETGGGASWLVHVFGGYAFVSRLAHAFGYSRTSRPSAGRFIGMVGAWSLIPILSIANLWLFIAARSG